MNQILTIIIYIIVANIAYLVFNLIRQGFKLYANYIAQLLFLMIGIIWLLKRQLAPGWVFFISLVGIYILIVLPSQLQRKIDLLIAEKRYDEIDFFAKIKAWIAWSNHNAHFQDIAEITSKYAESPIKMVEKLKELLGRGEPYDGMTRNFLGFIHFNNRNFNDLINDLRIPNKSLEEHSFEELLYLVRAYLETTRYEEAIEGQIALEKKAYEESEDKKDRKYNLTVSRLLFYSFMGWKDEYDELNNSRNNNLVLLTQELRDFWRGVCYFNSGNFTDGEELMKNTIEQLPEEAFPIKDMMQKRMFGILEHRIFFKDHILPVLIKLHDKYSNQLAELIKNNENNNIELVPQRKVTNILSFIITVISVIYIVLGKAYDTIDLLNIGAVSSFLVKNGEYFRLVSYGFIHIGYIHLFMNLFALKYFGPPVETIGGKSVFLFIFFASVISGGALSAYMGNTITAGASGGIFGLLTASIIFEIFKIKGSGSFSQQSNISNLIFILIANIAFGYFQKGIDNYAHFGGLIAGVILGIIFIPLIRNNNSKRIANIISFFLVVIIIASALYQHITVLKSNNNYPLNIKNYHSESISKYFQLNLPDNWKVSDISEKDVITANIKGPLGENIRIVKIDYNYPNEIIDKDSILKDYIKQKNQNLEENENLKINSIKPPIKVNYKENTYNILWSIAYEKSPGFLEDYFIFEKDSLCLINFSFATIHNTDYANVIEEIVKSFSLK